MRIWERLSYVFGVGLAVTYGLEEYIASLVMLGLTALALIIGAFMEGFRFPQWVFIVAYIPQIILVILDVFSIIALCIFCTFLAYAIIVTIIFGENDLNWVKMRGPYEVGYREFHTKEPHGLIVSVWYPMDKEEYAARIGEPGRNPPWLRYGYESREGVARATAAWGTEDHSHPWMFKYLDGITLNVVKDGKIAKDFSGGAARKMIPIVYVHGLSCNGVAQSVSCRDLASHGYIVFSMDHFDGSCYIAKRENGETRFFSAVEPWNERSLLFKKLNQREEECSALIEEICTSEKLLQEKCNFEPEVSMDLNKLILGGHSFGGLTSIYTARKDKRVKAVFGFDPFLYPIAAELVKEEIQVDQPQFYVVTEAFAPRITHYFEQDMMTELTKLINTSESHHQGELLMLRHSNHIHQTDAVVIIPVESTIASCTEIRLNYIDLYMVNTQSLILWLDEIGYGMEIDIKPVEDFVESMDEEFLDWRIRMGQVVNPDCRDDLEGGKDFEEGGENSKQEAFSQLEQSSYEICADEVTPYFYKSNKGKHGKDAEEDEDETASLLGQ